MYKYTVLTYIFNGYENVREIGESDPDAEYLLITDDPELKSVEKLAIVLGTEGDGLSDKTIADCDYTVCIHMYHNVDSLNVAAASAVAFWELRA
jgi:tRNA G18 (ribose-2'-O)-methylase SpoU